MLVSKIQNEFVQKSNELYMNVIKLKEFIELISQGDTGTPKQVSEKLGVSDRLVYYYVSVLKKEFKAPIAYCRKQKTYYFTEKGVIDLNWKGGTKLMNGN